MVTVGDYFALGFGSQIVQVGQNGSVPVRLISSAGLSNLSFSVELPAGRLTNLTVLAVAGEVDSVDIQSSATTRPSIIVNSRAGQSLQGDRELATFNFGTVSNQSSAFVTLIPTNVVAQKPSAALVTNVVSLSGRLVLIGREPLLESSLSTLGTPSLTLYGNPGSTHQLQIAPALGVANAWSNWMRVPMTNLMQILPGLNLPTNGIIFYRSFDLRADPPLLELRPSTSAGGAVTVFGLPGVLYRLESGQTVTGPWSTVRTFTPSNSFYYVDGLSVTNPAIFYRARKP